METRIKDDNVHDDLEGLKKQDQTCTEVERRQSKRAKNLNGVQVLVHYIHFCAAQNTKWLSAFNSLIFSAPKAYNTWPLLNLQNKVCKSKDLEGLNAKLT